MYSDHNIIACNFLGCCFNNEQIYTHPNKRGKEFVKLLLIGFALASPAAALLMDKVLEEFAYRIQLGPAIFLTGLVTTFTVAFLTVGYKSFTSASENPVNSLRAE